MANMMSAPRNRSVLGVDNPMNSDGFYLHRIFKGNRSTGAATGKRGWRRAIRAKEKAQFRRAIEQERG
jgi:hypothetical protein